jgi:hypothetical protein
MAGSILMLVCKEMAKVVLSPEAARVISTVPVSADTIRRPFSDMLSDTEVIWGGRGEN